MANPTITNVALISRFEHLAVASQTVIDGATIPADGVMQRGTLLAKGSSGKWHVFVHGTDVLAINAVRILMDPTKVVAAQDAVVAGWFEGFFKLSSLVDANPGLVAGDLTAAASFYMIESDEVRLK